MRILHSGVSLAAKLSQSTADLREQIQTTSQEAVTGRHSDLTAHLSGKIGGAMLSQKALDGIEQERGQYTLRSSRLDVVQRSLTVINDSLDGLDVQMLAALGQNDRVGQTSVARDARAALETAFLTLNARHGERFLFSGDATSTVPMGSVDDLLSDIGQLATNAATPADFEAALETYFNDPAGGWQQNIYNGTPASSDPDAVTAADPAITQLVSGLAVLALGHPGEGVPAISDTPDTLKAAALQVSSGKASLTDLRAERGLAQNQISRALETLDMEETVLNAAFNQMTARDQYEAASELKILEGNLEASYLLTTRLANLSLLNYLR
ncbi:MAG: hypothetical protein MRY64_01140 [Hyphomonadaceae bacterium]|nr:hypothetical protein [Hyphomonadaceae bacterium]